MFPANLLGLILTPILTKKFGKKALFMFGSVVVAIGYFARHFVPLDNLGLFIGISMVGSVTMMFCSITQWGMVRIQLNMASGKQEFDPKLYLLDFSRLHLN